MNDFEWDDDEYNIEYDNNLSNIDIIIVFFMVILFICTGFST